MPKKVIDMKITQWNKDAKYSHECKDHPDVKPTSYVEVYNLIGTSGCFKYPPYWDWSVMGIIKSGRGKMLVCPGDWVIEVVEDVFIVIDNETFQKSYLKDLC